MDATITSHALADSHTSGLLACCVALLGCGQVGETASPASPPSVIVGVTSDAPMESTIDRLETILEAPENQVVAQHIHEVGAGIVFPLEVAFPPLADSTPVVATVLAHPPGGGAPALIRVAKTEVEAGRTLLLRMRLNDECLPRDDESVLSCGARTCVAGMCEDPFRSPGSLEEYRADWAEPYADACAPLGGGQAAVLLGYAEPPFETLEPGALFVPEWGPQGASHIFFSARVQHLHGEGAITAVTGAAPGAPAGSVQKIPLSYEPGEVGCELFGLRFVLLQNGAFNTTMRLGVTVIDVVGNASHSHVDVEVAEPVDPPF